MLLRIHQPPLQNSDMTIGACQIHGLARIIRIKHESLQFEFLQHPNPTVLTGNRVHAKSQWTVLCVPLKLILITQVLKDVVTASLDGRSHCLRHVLGTAQPIHMLKQPVHQIKVTMLSSICQVRKLPGGDQLNATNRRFAHPSNERKVAAEQCLMR
ncbi:hypothetical protein BCR44DRAFT_1428587 [Catenaria anguillulae PL171]|uniref:Uncharacterized protein n=1 Tax=Catenaria anguillulae PL171 TaxID=765915 RepID=A0A1Y2HZL4_9FUNG|nr:hypothetical protein BCR44DRAFT_1428587 [Catenaria anguillulae PL171]